MKRLLWSPEAENDLLDIWGHVAAASASRHADTQLRDIAASCSTLMTSPQRGRPRDAVRPGLRSILSHPYVVFYRVADDVEIVRILHQRRDLGLVFGTSG